jgi:hypothetical protein
MSGSLWKPLVSFTGITLLKNNSKAFEKQKSTASLSGEYTAERTVFLTLLELDIQVQILFVTLKPVF